MQPRHDHTARTSEARSEVCGGATPNIKEYYCEENEAPAEFDEQLYDVN